MHVFFDAERRPFLLDSQMRWEVEPNAFLTKLSLANGKTSSPCTWRSYAYQLADWLSFCERANLDWKRASELNLATYRNIIASESSPHTGRPLKRSTINHKLTVICEFYKFSRKKGWIDALPFELETTRLSHCWRVNLDPCAKTHLGSRQRMTLKLTEGKEELEIPPRREVRRFVRSFRTWRDQLIAQVMWLTGMRCAEVCSLPLNSLPDDPGSLQKETVVMKIKGKGNKWRAIPFPLRLLRSIDRYIHMERRRHVRLGPADPGTVFLGRGGKPLRTSAIEGVFSTNCKRTGLQITPHLLRHGYAVERLAYLQDIGAPNPLKTLQMELGHAHMATTERYLHVTEQMRGDVIDMHNSFVDRLLEG